ncbi:MAG TPA: serine/threonine-protein kinase [Actinomycetospora sp.]|uniref:serine/threonine-protein kinase n=1 Tax=Actinomycetospora sp. TaxID=1872135 RepID=UPI002F3F5F57
MTEVGAGATIGRYRLEELLGRGGMGEVWRAYDTGRERTVGLKLLLQPLAHDAEFVARFRREARLAARLSDPHILPIHDFGELEGRLYIDMRLVDGPDLAKVVSGGPVPPDRTAAVVAQIASALDAAHAGGLVHRDVKPANVLLAARDPVFAYLTDFGVAAEQDRSENLTSAGTIIGTLAYLAPETFEGRPPGPSSDIYALGCVLAEALIGHPPFRTSTPLDAMRAHFDEPPPRPSEQVPGVPPAFDEVVARAMAKDPARRYQTAAELGAAVTAAVTAPVSPPRAVPSVDATAAVPTTAAPTSAAPAPAASPAPSAPPATTGGGSRTSVGRPPAVPLELPAPPVGRMALRPDYRVSPGPLRYPSPMPFLGNQSFVDTVRQWLHFSPGGSLLLTGAAGSGRTTVVARALDELHTELVTETEPTPVVVVWEPLGRPATPEELVLRWTRGLAEALERAGVVPRLSSEVAELLDVTNRRAHYALGLAEAEQDFVRLVAALAEEAASGSGSRRWFRRGGSEPWSGRLVVVLDDVDELTADEAGPAAFETIVRALANVLTTTPVHFVFAAGVDVLDLTRRSGTRASGTFSTIFGRALYVHGLGPGAAAELLRGVLRSGGAEPGAGELADHLEYRSQGLPRPLLAELDELVEWHPDGPHVVIDQPTALAISFHAALQRRLGPLWAQARPRGPLTHAVDVDRRRYAAHLVVDWVLDRRGTTFTASDFLADRTAARSRGRDLASDDECLELLRELVPIGLLESREPDSPAATFIGAPGPTETVYRLPRAVLDAAALVTPAPELGRVGDGRYVLVEELGRRALGRTYRAHDTFTNRDVAIKLLDVREQKHDDVARARFRREVALSRRLDHPLLAVTAGVLDDHGRLGLVHEFVPGLPLDELLARGPLAPPVAVDLTLGLLDLLHHLAGAGVSRLDLTPSHIVVTPDGRPVVVELGLGRTADADGVPERLTAPGLVVGTPLYLSPEQLRGRPVDARSDLYSLGLILVEMLTGVPARRGSAATIIAQAPTHRVEVGTLPCSRELREVLVRLLDPDPDARFADAAALAGALAAVPER